MVYDLSWRLSPRQFFSERPNGVLAEFAQGPSVANPQPSPGAIGYDLQVGDGQLALRILFSDRSKAAWQDEICRSFLLLLALQRNHATEPPPTVSGAPDAGNVRCEFIGLQIRAHLAGYTEQCRFADSDLIPGETGTGKELAARALDRLWKRSGELVGLLFVCPDIAWSLDPGRGSPSGVEARFSHGTRRKNWVGP